jgi:hypothetical protein
MLRRFRKLVWPHRERLLSLVLLPAFVLGTLPQTACICADGHRELSCKAAVCRALAEGSTTAECCGCDCCQQVCGQEQKSCCAKQVVAARQTLFEVTAPPSTCCNPIIEIPAPANAIAKAEVSLKFEWNALARVVPTLELAGICTGFHLFDFKGPPLDLVIEFNRLTI